MHLELLVNMLKRMVYQSVDTKLVVQVKFVILVHFQSCLLNLKIEKYHSITCFIHILITQQPQISTNNQKFEWQKINYKKFFIRVMQWVNSLKKTWDKRYIKNTGIRNFLMTRLSVCTLTSFRNIQWIHMKNRKMSGEIMEQFISFISP